MAATHHVPLYHNTFGIDCRTTTATKLYHRLKQLKSVSSIDRPDPYREDPSYCQIMLTTSMTERELDHWLYTCKHGADYIGVFTRTEAP